MKTTILNDQKINFFLLIFLDEKIIGAVEVNQQRWFTEHGLWLENVAQTHLGLASGKPVQEKIQFPKSSIRVRLKC